MFQSLGRIMDRPRPILMPIIRIPLVDQNVNRDDALSSCPHSRQKLKCAAGQTADNGQELPHKVTKNRKRGTTDLDRSAFLWKNIQ